jgi:hypothetical protein
MFENLKEIVHFEAAGLGGRIILKWTYKKFLGIVEWIIFGFEMEHRLY